MKAQKQAGNSMPPLPTDRRQVAILLQLPTDEVALMRGIAGYHEQSLEQWMVQSIRSNLEADLQGASADLNTRSNAIADIPEGRTS